MRMWCSAASILRALLVARSRSIRRARLQAVTDTIGAPLAMPPREAARGIAEIVDETMASAARVHAVENGKETSGRTLIAFGGAAPLHAVRLAQKLGIRRIVVPPDAGVGSALGFLGAPIAYEVVRTLLDAARSAGPADDRTHCSPRCAPRRKRWSA